MSGSGLGAQVLEALSQACSQNTGLLKGAEESLRDWETQPGFYSILLTIFNDYTVEVNVRWLAVLYFKNGVDKYWRKNAPNAISEEEKIALRPRLIANFSEPVHQVAMQIAVLIGKIARLDCPHHWAELVPTLISAIKCQDVLIRQRSLLIFYHVTKTLASKRLAHDRKVFEELSQNIFSFMLELWTGHTDNFFRVLAGPCHMAELQVSVDNALLALRVLRKLCIYGFPDLQKDHQVMAFVSMTFQQMNAFAKAKDQINSLGGNLSVKRQKMMTLVTKLLLDMLEMQPAAFVQFIRPGLEVSVNYNFTTEGKNLSYERFSVNTLNIMRGILRCELYRPAKVIEDTKNLLTVEAYRVKMEFFTSATLAELCRRLLLDYFPLTSEDLESWDSDPEEFIAEEGGDSWKFSLRPCTENLYLTLFKEFRETLTPCVLQIVKEHQSAVESNNLSAILKKDAVYNAVSLASFDLYDDIDFDSWFTTQLLTELQNKDPNFRILRRRIIQLCGNWVGVKMSHDLRPVLYDIIIALLDESEDVVVRLSAAVALQNAVDDFEFQREGYLPFLEATFNRLFHLLKHVRECETKMQVLHVMSYVVERVGSQIRPHSAALLQYLPLLWVESEQHDMLRCAILTTLINLVMGLGMECTSMYEFLLPVIQLSTDLTQPAHVYLLEDALELWEMTLHCAPGATPDLLALFNNMPPLLDGNTENLRICLKITESYILLGGKDFMQAYSETLITSLISGLSDMKSEGIVMVMKVLELILQAFPEEGPSAISPLLPTLLRNCMQEELYPMEFAVYLCILGRIALQNQKYFLDFMEAASVELGQTGENLLSSFLEVWLDKMDNVVQSDRKKLLVLSLLSLLQTNRSSVLKHFGSIISACVECLHDVCREEDGIFVDTLVQSTIRPDNDEQDTQHEIRKRHLVRNDPVSTLSLHSCLVSELGRLQSQHGADGWKKLMEHVDPDICTQLRVFVKES